MKKLSFTIFLFSSLFTITKFTYLPNGDLMNSYTVQELNNGSVIVNGPNGYFGMGHTSFNGDMFYSD